MKKREVKIYKTAEDALNAKHDIAKKFITKIGIEKIANLGQKL